MFYEQVFSALQQHQVRYAVAGGVAVNLHGIPRMTADLDLVLALDDANLLRFLSAMRQLGYQPRLPVAPEDLLDPEKRKDWAQNRNLHAFTFWNKIRPFEEVDILLTASETPAIVDRAIEVPVEDLTLRLVALDDLIAMKRLAGREQDIADLKLLQKLKEPPEND